MDYPLEFSSLIARVSLATGRAISSDDYEIIDRGIPHTPPTKIPIGKMAVYCFIHNGRFLKVGKANAKSKERYCYQHYNPKSAPSTLAMSILKDNDYADMQLDDSMIGTWIKNNCQRVDVLIKEELGVFALDLIEKVLQYRYEPKYEGFKSQR